MALFTTHAPKKGVVFLQHRRTKRMEISRVLFEIFQKLRHIVDTTKNSHSEINYEKDPFTNHRACG
jgi:hypothetical protein